MNRKRAIWVGIIVIAATTVFVAVGNRGTVAARAGSPSTKEVPKFEVDPSWPKIPNGWTLGQVSSAASDPQNNIWILHRPRTVKPNAKAAPPVLEFDEAGNYIQGWG